MSIRLVAIDIDGTLLDSRHKITPRAKEAPQKTSGQGIRIVLCADRLSPDVKEQLDELALYDESDFAVTYNGSLAQVTKGNTIISCYTLSYEDFLEIEVYSRKVGAHLYIIGNSTIYIANRNIGKYMIHEASLVNMPLKCRTTNEMAPEMNIIKMMMVGEPGILDPTIAKLPLHFTEKHATVKSTPFYYEIMNKNASKGNALVKLAGHLGLNKDEVTTTGNNESGLPVIDYAEIDVAVDDVAGNTKTITGVHTISNDEDGVAQIIEEMVLA